MRRTLTLVLVLTLGATAQAHTKRLTVDEVDRWTTPQKYGRNEPVLIRAYVNGQQIHDTHETSVALAGQGVIIEVRNTRRRRIRFRIANARKRDAKVRLVYRRL